MRTFGLALSVCLTLIGVAPAAVAADADVLQGFGMLGRIAVDCGAPYSPSNPHQIYAISPMGGVTRTLKIDDNFNAALPLRNLRMLTPDLLQFEEIGRALPLTVSIVKIDGKFRNWQSTQANGITLIADGKFADRGKSTITFKFCGN